MASAKPHGAAAAAETTANNRRASPSWTGRNDSANSGNSNNNNEDDRTGLLAAEPGGPEGHVTISSSAIVPAGDFKPSSLDKPRNPRTPRTPNRVRFDLRPTFVDDGDDNAAVTATKSNGTATSPDTPHHQYHQHPPQHDGYHPPRESFDLDEADPLSSPTSHQQQQRVPLLTGLEAPSVTLSNTLTSPNQTRSPSPTLEHAHEHAHGHGHGHHGGRAKSSLLSAFSNMANSIIGAGIIGQPYAFRQAGLVSGTFLLVVLTLVVDWTIRLIVVNSKLSGASSFQGTVEKCFGRAGLVAISLAQWAFAFGGMVAFGVIVGDSVPSVLRAVWPGAGGWVGRNGVVVFLTVGVSWPLSLYRDIAKLAKASTLALVSMMVIVVTVLVQGILVPMEERGALKDWRLLVVNDGIFQAIGVISFAFVCHHNSLLIYGSLEKPTIDRFARVTHYSTAVSMLACLIMALSGFLTFGDKTQGNVLNNFPSDNTMVNIARLCFGLNMLTTLPLEAFVCREVMLNYFWPGEPFNMKLHLLLTTSLVFSAMVLSLLTCDLGTVFDLVGGTSAAAMAYILPPLCYIKLTTRSWRTYLAWGVAAFGCMVMAMSFVQAVWHMIKGEESAKQCY